MATTLKILGNALPSNTSNAALYTVPSSTSAVVSSIVVCNQTTTAATCRIGADAGGDGPATSDWIVYDVSVGPNETIAFTLGVTLATTDKIWIRTGTASALSFAAFGQENT